MGRTVKNIVPNLKCSKRVLFGSISEHLICWLQSAVLSAQVSNSRGGLEKALCASKSIPRPPLEARFGGGAGRGDGNISEHLICRIESARTSIKCSEEVHFGNISEHVICCPEIITPSKKDTPRPNSSVRKRFISVEHFQTLDLLAPKCVPKRHPTLKCSE